MNHGNIFGSHLLLLIHPLQCPLFRLACLMYACGSDGGTALSVPITLMIYVDMSMGPPSQLPIFNHLPLPVPANVVSGVSSPAARSRHLATFAVDKMWLYGGERDGAPTHEM